MNTLILLLSGVFGIGFTFFLKKKFEMNTVRASSITIVVGCGIQHLLTNAFPDQIILLKVPYLICGASFCGMSSSVILKKWYWVLGCGLVYTWIFILSASTFTGMGGELGTGACLAVLFFYGLMLLEKKIEKFIFIRNKN
jgi:hypothetical protein